MSDMSADNIDATATDLGVTVPGIVLESLSRHRVMDALEGLELAYQVSRTGAISVDFGDARFPVRVVGQHNTLLCVQGFWARSVPAVYRADLLEFCNTWNADQYIGGACVVEGEDGTLSLSVDHSVDYVFGLTDEQLYQHLNSAFSTGLTFFEEAVRDLLGETGDDADAATDD